MAAEGSFGSFGTQTGEVEKDVSGTSGAFTSREPITE